MKTSDVNIVCDLCRPCPLPPDCDAEYRCHTRLRILELHHAGYGLGRAGARDAHTNLLDAVEPRYRWAAAEGYAWGALVRSCR